MLSTHDHQDSVDHLDPKVDSDASGGKVSVSDSGIGIEKGFDERFSNVFIGMNDLGDTYYEKNAQAVSNTNNAEVGPHHREQDVLSSDEDRTNVRQMFAGTVNNDTPLNEADHDFELSSVPENSTRHSPAKENDGLNISDDKYQPENTFMFPDTPVPSFQETVQAEKKQHSSNGFSPTFKPPVRVFATNFMKIGNSWLSEDK